MIPTYKIKCILIAYAREIIKNGFSRILTGCFIDRPESRYALSGCLGIFSPGDGYPDPSSINSINTNNAVWIENGNVFIVRSRFLKDIGKFFSQILIISPGGRGNNQGIFCRCREAFHFFLNGKLNVAGK